MEGGRVQCLFAHGIWAANWKLRCLATVIGVCSWHGCLEGMITCRDTLRPSMPTIYGTNIGCIHAVHICPRVVLGWLYRIKPLLYLRCTLRTPVKGCLPVQDDKTMFHTREEPYCVQSSLADSRLAKSCIDVLPLSTLPKCPRLRSAAPRMPNRTRLSLAQTSSAESSTPPRECPYKSGPHPRP